MNNIPQLEPAPPRTLTMTRGRTVVLYEFEAAITVHIIEDPERSTFTAFAQGQPIGTHASLDEATAALRQHLENP